MESMLFVSKYNIAMFITAIVACVLQILAKQRCRMKERKERGRGGEGRGGEGRGREGRGRRWTGTEEVGEMGTGEGGGEVVGKGRSQYFLLGPALTTTEQ